MKRIKLKKIRQKGLSCLLALSMVTPTIASLPINVVKVYAEVCPQEHDWTGLKFNWTDIPASQSPSGAFLGWPRKTYFTDGNSKYKNFANHYIFCIANHTNGQRDIGQEAYAVKNLTINDWEEYKGYGNTLKYGDRENKKFAFCLVVAGAEWSYQRTSASDVKSQTANLGAYAYTHSLLVAVENRFSTDGSHQEYYFHSKDDKEGSYTAFLNNMNFEFGASTTSDNGAKLTDELSNQLLPAQELTLMTYGPLLRQCIIVYRTKRRERPQTPWGIQPIPQTRILLLLR